MDCFKLNADAATDYTKLGSIICNDQGLIMAVSSQKVAAGVSVDNAEALAILSRIQLAVDVGISPILVESDSKVVVDLIIGIGASRTSLGLIVERIRILSRSSQIISFTYVPRAANATAHTLSMMAISKE
ncbi:hypothetical protein ACOSQ3_032410 [Xanthoceras sorbifolium]